MQQRYLVKGDFGLCMLHLRVLWRIQKVLSSQLFPKAPSGTGLSRARCVPVAVPGSDVVCREAAGPERGTPALPEGWALPLRITGQQQVVSSSSLDFSRAG